ncbi:MAG: DUF1273 family protein [Oscillospiraceae bacterium]|nr:DUF1273 family protein [Oscillospiraceae bacterium]
MKTCSFTGHRVLKQTDELKNSLENEILKLIENGITDFYTGGARGWDMLCAETVLKLKTKYVHICLHLILPCPPKAQMMKWTDSDKKRYDLILRCSDSVEIISELYNDQCMRQRNIRLVELADIILCFYSNRIRSGTGQTIRLAQKKGIYIVNLYP